MLLVDPPDGDGRLERNARRSMHPSTTDGRLGPETSGASCETRGEQNPRPRSDPGIPVGWEGDESVLTARGK